MCRTRWNHWSWDTTTSAEHTSKEQPRDSFTSDFPKRIVRRMAKPKMADWSRACTELKTILTSGNLMIWPWSVESEEASEERNTAQCRSTIRFKMWQWQCTATTLCDCQTVTDPNTSTVFSIEKTQWKTWDTLKFEDSDVKSLLLLIVWSEELIKLDSFSVLTLIWYTHHSSSMKQDAIRTLKQWAHHKRNYKTHWCWTKDGVRFWRKMTHQETYLLVWDFHTEKQICLYETVIPGPSHIASGWNSGTFGPENEGGSLVQFLSDDHIQIIKQVFKNSTGTARWKFWKIPNMYPGHSGASASCGRRTSSWLYTRIHMCPRWRWKFSTFMLCTSPWWIAESRPARLDRAVWRKFSIYLHGDMALRQAISHVLGDSTFWQLELFERNPPTLWQEDSVWTEGIVSHSYDSWKVYSCWSRWWAEPFLSNHGGKSKGKLWSLVCVAWFLVSLWYPCLVDRSSPSLFVAASSVRIFVHCYNWNHKQNHDHRHTPTFLLPNCQSFQTEYFPVVWKFEEKHGTFDQKEQNSWWL